MNGPLNSQYSGSSAADIIRTSTGRAHLILKFLMLKGEVNQILSLVKVYTQKAFIFL